MVSTWQLFSDAGDDLRWEISPPSQPSHQRSQLYSSPPTLPSFHDVLLEGCSKILEVSEERNVDINTPMFRTGLGSSVVLKKSSIAKASSVLGDDFIGSFDTGKSFGKGHKFSSPNSMFQTGSGKKVDISSAGLLRAKALLGMDENNDVGTFQGVEPAKKKLCRVGMGSPEKGSLLKKRQMVNNIGRTENDTFRSKLSCFMNDSSETEFVDEGVGKLIGPKLSDSTVKPSAIKFQTASGRFISVSGDALQRARNLLGDPEMDTLSNEEGTGASMFSFAKHGNAVGSSFNQANKIDSSQKFEQNPKIFVSPLKSSSNKILSEAKSENLVSGTNLIRKFDAEASICKSNGPGFHKFSKPSGMPLVDITNTVGIDSAAKKGATSDLRRLGRRSSVSPFKMPRSSKFITPLNSNHFSAPNGFPCRESEAPDSRKKVCTSYPFQRSRLYIKEFFKVPPTFPEKLEHLPKEVRHLNPQTSGKFAFHDGSQLIDAEKFHHMLVQSGASVQLASKEWVANHCKWIVWKLASYERCYSPKFMKKFLTVSNVLVELKYRYEREVNHGQRSAIKRILEGDASPSSMLVLCVSDIESRSSTLAGKSSHCTIEVTDGWYSICAQLDPMLSKQLAGGRIFVGQKLRICGAGFSGWNGPISPIEAFPTVSLLLHINGTYRASWHERLGFCRGACVPLAFRCIKDDGGLVPWTIVGVKRIYPVLFRERLKSGGYIVRSEKMEASFALQHNQRRSNVIEAITLDFQRGSSGSFMENDYDKEGAKILKMLESAAEPELLMAEMSSEQLTSFSKYRAKVEENRQCNLQKAIEEALEDAGISAREVNPIMRVRVVGLNSKGHHEGEVRKEGLITIWNPTEQQKHELVEGEAYAISGLSPSHSDSDTLYLHTRGSNTKWRTLTLNEKGLFEPFFDPRKPVMLSGIGEVSSDFDTVALVLHVGLEFASGHQQKKQWMFVTDGSLCELQMEESTNSLLAISFESPCTDDDSVSPINYNLVGSIIGFCDLVKRNKDHVNHMWVAEATENSTYYLNFDNPNCYHLKDSVGLVKKWKQSASLKIEKLREKVLRIVGCPGP